MDQEHHEEKRAAFDPKSINWKELSQELKILDTLGQGTYGRVRLAKIDPPEDGSVNKRSGLYALKILKKSEIIRLKQAEHVRSERTLLFKMSYHPFIVNAYRTYKDDRNLYLLQEYVPAGHLDPRNVARSDDPLGEGEGGYDEVSETYSNKEATFYAAQLVMALQFLHADGIVYRGLVPDNLLLDANGYLKLVDFGFAKRLDKVDGEDEKTYTLCGTAEYLAPEMVSSKGHSKGVDWWALGIVIYEMLAGYPPFYDDNPFNIYQKILKGEFRYPEHFESVTHEGVSKKDNTPVPNQKVTGLIPRLLKLDVKNRIGCLKSGAEDIKKHKWFRGLNWAALYNKQMPATRIPHPDKLAPEPSAYYPKYPDSLEESGPLLEKSKQELFDYWSKEDKEPVV